MLEALGSEHAHQDYRKAERRLRDALLGDGMYSAGLAKGDEARTLVTRELRKMREAVECLETLVRDQDAARAAAATHIAQLEDQVKALTAHKRQKTGGRKAA